MAPLENAEYSTYSFDEESTHQITEPELRPNLPRARTRSEEGIDPARPNTFTGYGSNPLSSPEITVGVDNGYYTYSEYSVSEEEVRQETNGNVVRHDVRRTEQAPQVVTGEFSRPARRAPQKVPVSTDAYESLPTSQSVPVSVSAVVYESLPTSQSVPVSVSEVVYESLPTSQSVPVSAVAYDSLPPSQSVPVSVPVSAVAYDSLPPSQSVPVSAVAYDSLPPSQSVPVSAVAYDSLPPSQSVPVSAVAYDSLPPSQSVPVSAVAYDSLPPSQSVPVSAVGHHAVHSSSPAFCHEPAMPSPGAPMLSSTATNSHYTNNTVERPRQSVLAQSVLRNGTSKQLVPTSTHVVPQTAGSYTANRAVLPPQQRATGSATGTTSLMALFNQQRGPPFSEESDHASRVVESRVHHSIQARSTTKRTKKQRRCC